MKQTFLLNREGAPCFVENLIVIHQHSKEDKSKE